MGTVVTMALDHREWDHPETADLETAETDLLEVVTPLTRTATEGVRTVQGTEGSKETTPERTPNVMVARRRLFPAGIKKL